MQRLAKITISLLLFLALAILPTGLIAKEAQKAPPPTPQKVELTPQEIENRFRIADSFLRTREYSKARDAYRALLFVLKDINLQRRALIGVINAEYNLKHFFETKTSIQKLFKNYKLTADIIEDMNFILGNIALQENDLKAAEVYFSRLKTYRVDDATVGFAEIWLRKGDILKAEITMLRLPQRVFDNNHKALYVRAMAAYHKGLFSEAVNIISKIPEYALIEHGYRVDKAKIFLSAGRDKDAETQLRRIISAPASYTETVQAKQALFAYYKKTGNTENALKIASELLNSKVEDDFRLEVSDMFAQNGDLQKAIHYLIYMQDTKRRSEAMQKRMQLVMQNNDPKSIELVAKFNGYLDYASPFFPETIRYLYNNDRKLLAKGLLRRAMTRVITNEMRLMQVEILVDEGEYVEANYLLESLIKHKQYAERANLLYAKMRDKQGRPNEAEKYYAQAMKLSKSPEIALLLAERHLKKGDKLGAAEYYAVAAQRGDNASLIKSADIYYFAGNTKKASELYKQAIKIPITDENLKQWLYYQYGKLFSDKEYLKKAASGGGEIGKAANILLGNGGGS